MSDHPPIASEGMRGEVPPGTLRAFYDAMVRIRLFEERVADLVEEKEINTPTHLYIGQEAVAVGVCAALRRDDYIMGTHRSHGHYLAKGGDMRSMMAELLGKQTGCSRGRGGSMHLIAPEVGVMGTVPIVSGTVPITVGLALASRLQGLDRVSVAFLGDGTLEEGTTHESLILAAHRRLPVVFVCENNFYASHLGLLERRAEDNIPQTATAHGVAGVRLDGNDVVEVYGAASRAVARARAGVGPTLLECRTYRWRGHVGPSWDMDVGVKRKNELDEWFAKDPIARVRERLQVAGVPREEFERTTKALKEEIESALVWARESPFPAGDELMRHVFHEGGEASQ